MKNPAQDLGTIRNKLKLHNIQGKQGLREKYAHINSSLLDTALNVEKLRQHSSRLLSAGAITGSLMFSGAPDINNLLPPPQEIIEKLKTQGSVIPLKAPQKILIDSIKQVLPQKVRPLNREEEKSLERIFSEVMNIEAKATLEGEHLNTTYGLIGAEQHLRRFPGDSMSSHLDTNAQSSLYKEGMAPGLGAWGYFAPSKDKLTPQLVETEKWYAVVQTLYLPDWNTRTKYLRDWYKYRKVLIVNTNNGNAVVASVADSGPAMWTGKSFGGSPEVMEYLGGPRYKKGPVVIFFLDDPDNKVKLGPVEYNKINLPEWAFHQV